MSLTGNKETDFLILMQLTDNELTKVCQVNKYVNKLCNDDNFWRNRIIINFKYTSSIANAMMQYLEFDNWKEFYIWLTEWNEKERDLIVDSLKPENIEIVETIVKKIKSLPLLKWINKEEFYKVVKRYAFVNVSPEINEDYLDEDYSTIDDVAWKIYGSLNHDELLEIFLNQWNKGRNSLYIPPFPFK